MRSIYLDYAATTPIDSEVSELLSKLLSSGSDNFGNSSSLHSFGQKARALLDDSRRTLAETIAANHSEVIFTSSATEANNLIIRGALKAFFKNRKSCNTVPQIIISSTEHPSISETVKALEKDGAVEITYLPVDSSGVIDLTVLEKTIDEKTILVSVIWINNETGVIQPVEKISHLISEFKKSKPSTPNSISYPLVHSDAVQAFNLFDLNVLKSGIDFMTLSSHKICGPKGAGALYIKGGADEARIKWLDSVMTGGGQEYGLRSGTENTLAVAGFAKAAEIAYEQYKKEFSRLTGLSKRFFEKIKNEIPDVEINGSFENRSPHILNLWFPRHENIQISLDMIGVATSAGSACAQRYAKASPILLAMGYDEQRAKESIRFSFGRFTTEGDIDEAAARIVKVLKK